GRAAFTIGGGGSDCTFPATGPSHCGHALTDGFSAVALAGARFFPEGSGQITPWVGGGVGAGLAGLTRGSVAGFAVPLWAAAGARVPVADGVALAGELLLDLAATAYGKGIGLEGSLGMTIVFGVDFRI